MTTAAKTYQFPVHYEQDKDGIYIADVPALPGCHSFGETFKEAEQNVRDAIIGYLAVLDNQGKPIPDEKIHTGIYRISVKVSMSEFVRNHQKKRHVFYAHPDGRVITIPNHSKKTPRKTIRRILRDTKIIKEISRLLL